MKPFHPLHSIAEAMHARRAKQQTFSAHRLRLLWLTWRSSWSGMMMLLTLLGLLGYLPVLFGSPIDGLRTPSSKTAVRQFHPVTRLPSNWFPFGADSNVSHLSLPSLHLPFTDTTAPVLHLPPHLLTRSATSSLGAVVTYVATATDPDTPPSQLRLICSPPSGSIFPIGTTTVYCQAHDPAGNSTTGSFQILVKDTTPPVLHMPASPLIADATNPQGAFIVYIVTATDPDNPSNQLSISCSPPSGSTFPVGTTPVHCRASDPTGNTTTGSFQVVVKDVTAPTLYLPASPLTINATSPLGAFVVYTVTATDPDNYSYQLSITCSPPSGSTFPIGTTTVYCHASDPSGNTTTGFFQVIVNGMSGMEASALRTRGSMTDLLQR